MKLTFDKLSKLVYYYPSLTGYPGASTVASQPLDRKTAPMAGKSPQTSHEPPFQAPVTLMKQWKEEKGDGRGGGGVGGGDAERPLPKKPQYKTLKNSQILAVYKATQTT